MIQIAWEWLVAHGSLTNRHLLSKDGLNVKRSSFVCALLGRLPGVEVVGGGRPIEIALMAPRGSRERHGRGPTRASSARSRPAN
jgi:hypothetical protein